MIARAWTGVVATEDLDEYVDYVEVTGVAEYGRTPGCRLAATLTRELDGDLAEVVTFTVWESTSDLQAFTGPDINQMRLYDRDAAFLREDSTLVHHDVRSLFVGAVAAWGDDPADPPRGSGRWRSGNPEEPLGTAEALARAFSGHRFAETFNHLAGDVRWTQVGRSVVEGREAVIQVCEDTMRDLAEVSTTWLRFVSTAGPTVVAVDAVGRYDGPDGVSTVSSCDVYEFADGRISAIGSYAVEVNPDNVGSAPSA